jgi:hypothetical protein
MHERLILARQHDSITLGNDMRLTLPTSDNDAHGRVLLLLLFESDIQE